MDCRRPSIRVKREQGGDAKSAVFQTKKRLTNHFMDVYERHFEDNGMRKNLFWSRSGEVMLMRNLKRLGAVAIAIALLAAVPTMAADITVGQFVQQLARAKNLNATDAQAAADATRSVLWGQQESLR